MEKHSASSDSNFENEVKEMEITRKLKTRILIQTIFFAAVFLLIGAAGGYYAAIVEMSHKILMESSK